MAEKKVARIERPQQAAVRKLAVNGENDYRLEADEPEDGFRQLLLFEDEKNACENIDSGLLPAQWEERSFRRVVRSEEKCWQCGACVGFCPTGACHVADRRTMEIGFNEEKCTRCERCLVACPSRAMRAVSYRLSRRERGN